jgi:hypothetical protein
VKPVAAPAILQALDRTADLGGRVWWARSPPRITSPPEARPGAARRVT